MRSNYEFVSRFCCNVCIITIVTMFRVVLSKNFVRLCLIINMTYRIGLLNCDFDWEFQ